MADIELGTAVFQATSERSSLELIVNKIERCKDELRGIFFRIFASVLKLMEGISVGGNGVLPDPKDLRTRMSKQWRTV